MTPNVDEFPPCSACGGRLLPLVRCDSCGSESILRDVRKLDWTAPCAACGTFNPWQFVCDECHSRFPAPGTPAKPSSPKETQEVSAGAPGRPKRRIKGEVDTSALLDLLKVLGLDPSRSQAIIDHGYDALWKLAGASQEDLARIPEVGPVAARKMLASLHLIRYSPPHGTKELILQEEYACPLCGCITSAFAPECLDCGASFDEEEMDESIRREFAAEGDGVLLAFYDGRLAETPADPDLLYARALLLHSLGRNDEAIELLDRAATTAPDTRKIKVAQMRIQAKEFRKPNVAEKLRSTASKLIADVAWDQEVAQLDHLISQAGSVCPSCGAAVPGEMALCPSCGERLAGVPREPVLEPTPPRSQGPMQTFAAPELDTLVDDLLVGELEQSLTAEELELTKAAVLDWLIEELEETMGTDTRPAVSPVTEAQEQAPAEPSPLSTSVGFLSGWMRGRRGLVSGLRPSPGSRGTGKVNGIVNVRSRVNGLVNGVSRVNGLVQPTGRINGLVDQQGRVNGVVGGRRFVQRGAKGIRLSSPSKRLRYAAIASGTLIAVLIAGVLFFPTSGFSPPIVIDGSFGDWASVPKFDAVTAAADRNVALDRYASLFDSRDGSLYLYASTRGPMFGDPTRYDGVDFLIDADGNASTGYQFDGIGAEAVVQVFGGNNTVAGARLYAFPPNSEMNWSQRQSLGSVSAAASGTEVEAKVSTYDMSNFNPTAFRISVYADDFRGSSSRSKVPLVSTSGAVLLELSPLNSLVSGGASPLFNIRARGMGVPASATWSVSSFLFNATPGVSVSLSAGSVTLTQGQSEATTTASVSAPGFSPGTVIQVDVTGASVSASVPVVVRGGPVRAYVLAPPSGVRVDGLFADWVGRDRADTDVSPVNNSDVNIVRYGAAVDSSAAYFHVVVAGELMEGRVPDRVIRRPQVVNGSGGPPIRLPRLTGEDILRVYIDLNATATAGLLIGGIYADHMLEVRGIAGRITTRTLYAWKGSWSTVASPTIALAKNATDIEGSVAIGPLTNTTRMVFEATDWTGLPDMTPAASAPKFSPMVATALGPTSLGGLRLMIMSGTNYTTVTATELTNVPTIDGNCGTSPGEYTGAASASSANIRFFAGLRSASLYVYLCVEVTADVTNDSTSDSGELLFDANLNGGSAPDTDDRLFRVTSGVSGTFTKQRGNGAGWVDCGISCDPGDAASGRFNGSKEVYEFKVRFADVWGSDTPSSGATAGFAIVARDQTGPRTYTWGADNVVESNPNTWVPIPIPLPEFSDYLLVSVSVLVLIGVQLRRRRS